MDVWSCGKRLSLSPPDWFYFSSSGGELSEANAGFLDKKGNSPQIYKKFTFSLMII